MTVPLPHPLPTDAALHAAASAPPHGRAQALRAPVAAFCGALAFLCFLPYPALPVGNTSALQAGNALVLLTAVPALLVSWKGRPFWVFPLLAAPLCLSALKAAVAGTDQLDVSLKGAVVWGVSMMAILAAQLCAPRHALPMLLGVAAACLLHAAVGLYQFYQFQQGGDFPLVGLYVNPGFLSVQDNATIIARYVQRPFGLFPEPSAMSASLAPWVLMLLAMSFGLLRLRDAALTTAYRLYFGAAGLAGLGLIIISRSGHAAPTCLAVVVLVAAWFARARATARTFLAVVVVFGVFLPAVGYLAAVSVGDRLGGKTKFGNSSWAERADSLAAGFDLIARSDLATNLLGVGVGLMSPRLKESSGLDAVFSVLLTYVFETGVVGALVVACVAYLLLRCWVAARYDMTFALAFGVWLVGVTLITSYELLLPLWLTLGWLTVWPEIFASGREEDATDDRFGGRMSSAPEGRQNLAHGVSRGSRATTPFPRLLLQPRRGVRIVRRWVRKCGRGHFPLSPVLRGEGRGEGLPPDIGSCHTPDRNEPLTLTLSPEYRGEGTSTPTPPWVVAVASRFRKRSALPLLRHQHGRDARVTNGAQRNTGVPPVLAIRTALTSLLSFTLRRAIA
jgi:hypothetical protein